MWCKGSGNVYTKKTDFDFYLIEMFNLVMLTKENLTPSEIDNMEFYDWDIYLEIIQKYNEGQVYKQKLDEAKIKSKSKK